MALRRSTSKNKFRSQSKFRSPSHKDSKRVEKGSSSIQLITHRCLQLKHTSSLRDLTPSNMQSQKDIFFSKECQYNPHFTYTPDAFGRKELTDYQTINEKYLIHTLAILDRGLQTNFNAALTEEEVLSQEQICEMFNDYKRDCNIGEQLLCQFVLNALASMSFNYQVSHQFKEQSVIAINLPIKYNKLTLKGAFNHEIGTHYLRRVNQQKQAWHLKRFQYRLSSDYLLTEEGLAAINQLLPFLQSVNKVYQPLLFKAAVLYYSCYLASKHSFIQQYSHLSKYLPDPNLNWQYCVRSRRGIRETKFGLGMYKDQVYLAGAIQILMNRKKINFKSLYSGKITIEDCTRLDQGKLIDSSKIRLPKFMQNIEWFQRALDKIAEANMI